MADKDLSQVESVFHAALDLPAGDRDRYIKEACNGDDRLAAEVSSLVSTYEHSNGFMDQPAVSLGLDVINRSSQESLIGKTFGVYRIISQLGKGGMGEVYLAEDTRLNRKVALKFLSQELVDDKWAKRQLVKEAQAAAMLDHANICPVYGIEEHGEYTFIVMQFVEGETLCELIQKQSITPEQTISLARQIAGALAEAHAHGIIHRDIKPRNIMVTNGGTVKVLDFGLAKSVLPKSLESLDDSISKFTDAGLVPGTIRYMSPEQLCNERLDYRSDLFSVGTVLYEIVSGKNPFERKTGPEVISAILSSSPQPLKQNGSRSSGLVPIISRCLSKDREQRFQSASELLIDLDKLEKGIAPNPLRLHRLRSVAILAVLLLTIGAAVYYYFGFAAKQHSVAVLDISCEDIPTELCLGASIKQQLINQLSRRSDLAIKSVNASQWPVDEKIRRELGVDTILSGKIVRRGDSLVLKTRLQNATNGTTVHENQHLVPSQTIPLIEELSIRLVFFPEAELTADDKATFAYLAALQKRAPDAFELYIRGKHFWDNRNKDNIWRAIDHFDQAIAKDPSYALAHAGLANSYAVLPTVAYGMANTNDAMPKAAKAARNALEIDENLAEAHIAMGIVQLRYDWNWKAAEKSFKRAIELQPDSASAYYWYSNVLGITGRVKEAIAASEKAKQLDPLTPQYVTNLGRAYYWARDFDKTIDYFQSVLSEKRDNTSAMYMLSLAYTQKQMYTEAIALLEELSSVKKNKWLAASLLGYAYAKVGRQREARNILNEMDAPTDGAIIPAQERAIVYMGLGDNDSAFYWLEKSYEERFGSIIALNIDALFDDLRRDPRFPVLVRKINLVP